MVKPITSMAEFNEVINGDKPVVIDFWATWCGPCKMISPVMDKISEKEEFAGVGFYKIDTDEQADISQELGISAMPTFMLFHKGNKIDEFKGAVPARLQKLVEDAAALTK